MHYLTISRVAGLDHDGDEFGVAFPARGKGTAGALATIRREGGADQIALVTFSAPPTAAVGDLLPMEMAGGSIGGAARTTREESIYLAARQPGTVSGDYDIFSGHQRSGRIDAPARMQLSALIPWDAQPAISPDGGSLYFASDRDGGEGATDIYVARRAADGSWSAPRNLGPGINTPCDELSPFVSGDGRWLYFSSSGHATVGGYDLFRARIIADGVGKAENLGKPINTPADEIFPSAPADADPDTLLYYSSNQTGSDGFDIYLLHRLKRPGVASPTALRNSQVTLTGVVRGPDGRPVPEARVTIETITPPKQTDSTLTDPDGRYRLPVRPGEEYYLDARSDSIIFIGERVRIPISDGRRTVTHDIEMPDTVTFRVNFPFNNATDPYEFTLDERGMPSDLRWRDMIDRTAEFLKGFNDQPARRFEIIGHTDPVGSDQFNLDLGRRRAEFIRQQLVRRGVRAAMLTVRSEGESLPLPGRDAETEELYHARLRRVDLVRR